MRAPPSKLRIGVCDVALADGGAPEWVHLLPPGRTTGRDGRVFDVVDPAALILDFEARGVSLPIDFEHQLDDDKTRTGPIPAAGWITKLKADDAGMWGKVEWTGTAAELIAQKAYRYLSPTFLFYPDTAEVVRVTGAGLVHKPNLPLKALASEDPTMTPPTNPAPSADPLAKRLIIALGLPADASDQQVFDLVERMVDTMRRLVKGAAEGARPAPAAATAAELVTAAQATPDPARYVPASAVEDMLRVRNAERAEAAEERARQKVRAALDGGHITPGLRDWALALCRADEASFDTFMAKSGAPWSVLFRQVVPSGPPPSAASGFERAPEGSIEATVCAQLGLKPDRLK